MTQARHYARLNSSLKVRMSFDFMIVKSHWKKKMFLTCIKLCRTLD